MEALSTRTIDWVSRYKSLTLRVRDFVNGEWHETLNGLCGEENVLRKRAPRDGSSLYSFAKGTAETADYAVAAARNAFVDGRWSKMPVQKRKEILFKFAELIERHREELALLESLDVGKPINDALFFDVPAAAMWIRSSAEAVDKSCGKVYAVDQTSLSYELCRPLGVVVAIIGWNFPLHLAAQKIGPALAAGNSLILKPSELASLSACRVAEMAVEAGVPAGVFNVIHGDGALGSTLAHHSDVDCLSFTGSTRTGKRLLVAAGNSNMKRLILECGGKAPCIVFEDCVNPPAVADAIANSAFWNQGQVCVATSRLLVQDSIKHEILQTLIKNTSTILLGDPLDPETRFGAVVSYEHRHKILQYAANAEQEGAQLICRGSSASPVEGGFYVPPMIFDAVSPSHCIWKEEIFGPILAVISFRDEAEAIRLANDTVYGLSATVWTGDPARAHRMSQCIDAGWIAVNSGAKPTGGPVDGVMTIGGHKESGVGVEGGIAGLESYMRRSAVQIFT